MTEPAKVIGLREARPTSERLDRFFHTLDRLIPDSQVPVCIPPEMPAREALELMRTSGFSQLPVKQGKEVLGLFTYRAFATEFAENSDAKADLAAQAVVDFIHHEKPKYARLSDDYRNLIDELEEKGSILVGDPENLVGILTPIDVLRYLHALADVFVLIEEIEQALRALIREATPDADVLQQCIENALSKKYEGHDREMPRKLEDMTFDDYIALLRDGRNYVHFVAAFGGTRERTRGRLEPVRQIRNDALHFRCEVSDKSRELVTNCKNWLHLRVRNVQALRGGAR